MYLAILATCKLTNHTIWKSDLSSVVVVSTSQSLEFAQLTASAVSSDLRGKFVTPWDHPFDVSRFSPQSMHFSHNSESGTLRGLHYTVPPFGQSKLVHCVRGRMFDVVVDMRANSPTFRSWSGFSLDADCGKSIWIPAGYAYGC